MLLQQSGLTQREWIYVAVAIPIGTILLYLVAQLLIKQFFARQKILTLLVERKTREIQMKNEELEKNNLIKTRLISIISHDLIAPLKFDSIRRCRVSTRHYFFIVPLSALGRGAGVRCWVSPL